MAEIRKHEVKYTVIEEFAEPIKEFADWAGRYDRLTARVKLDDGTEGYLGIRKNVTYLTDMEYKGVAKSCSKSGVMVNIINFSVNSIGLFSKEYICKILLRGYSAEYSAKYREVNKERIAECNAKYREINKERIAERMAEYYAANKERIAECNAKYSEVNKERIARYQAEYYVVNKERISEYNVEYYADNPHIKRVSEQKRRLAVIGGYNEPQFLAEFENSPTRTCWLSEYTTTDGTEVHIEHLMPISVNNQKPYGNSETNCYYLLGSLNISKGNKNVFDWIDSMSQSHLQFLLEYYPVELSLEQFREGMFRIIAELAEKQGLTFEQYKEQYNRDYAEGLQEKAC